MPISTLPALRSLILGSMLMLACTPEPLIGPESNLDVTPESDMEVPEPDMEAPEPDMEAPETDLEAPEPDMEAPEPDMEAPEPDMEAPEADMEAPELDMEAPELDMSVDMEPPPDPLEVALSTGDPSGLMGDDLSVLEAIIAEVDRLEANASALLQALFLDQPITYNPGRNSQHFTALGFSSTYPLITGAGGLKLAVGYEQGEARGVAFGVDLLARLQRGELSEVSGPTSRLLDWLLRIGDEATPQPRSIKVLGVNGGSLTDTLAYLNAQSVSRGGAWSVSACPTLNDPTLSTCLSGADLIVFGTSSVPDDASFVQALRVAQVGGSSLFYTHQHSWNSATVTASALSLIGVSIQSPGGPGNYFAQDSASWSSAEEQLSAVGSLGAFKRLALGALEGDFGFEVSACEGSCAGVEGYAQGFGEAVGALRGANSTLDQAGRSLFSLEGERLHKLLILLGDLWRAEVSFPLDRASSPSTSFLRAYYADHATLLARPVDLPAPDLGSFSSADLSVVEGEEVTLSYTSRVPFRSARVYALPGRSFTVERLDQSDAEVWVQVNSLRPGSTHEFDVGGYTRPKFLTSARVPLTYGAPITLMWPYGGPVMLRYGSNDHAVSVRFTGVGRHPVWVTPADDLTFQAALASSPYDWAELITPRFEVHSTKEKMINTLASPLASTGSALASLITEYHHGYSLALAGYQGPEIPTLPAITDFVTTRGWLLPVRDQVQHMNADQPTCGYGCSGNPYDAGWSFSPLGHGDLHEVGHNHERGIFKFNGREGHATTNPYSYYPKLQHSLQTGERADCQQLPFHALFDALQGAQNSADPYEVMHSDTSLHGWAEGVSTLIQALMVAQGEGVIEQGWELIGRLHAHDRTLRVARDDEAQWQALSGSLGLSQYSRQESGALSNNDYLLIALGAVTGLDYRDYFQMWGLELSATASAQVESEGYPSAPRVFYVAEPTGACEPWGELRAVPIDGVSLWVDLDALERQSVTLSAELWRSDPLSSEGSSVYYVTLDSAIGPTSRVWWGTDGQVTELRVTVAPAGDGDAQTLVIDAYQQRCDLLMTLNAGRVGGCEHRLALSVDPAKNPSLTPGVTYHTPIGLPLLLEAWRWHTPEERLDTLALDLSYTP